MCDGLDQDHKINFDNINSYEYKNEVMIIYVLQLQ